MDINDPRRRLQVLNNNSPSLRVQAAPQKPLKVAQVQQPRLFVGTQHIKPSATSRASITPPEQATPMNDPRTLLSKLVDSVNPIDDGRDFNNPGVQEAPNFLERNLSPTGVGHILKEVTQGAWRLPIEMAQTVDQNIRDVKSNEAGKGDAPFKKWNPSGWQKRLFGDKVSSYQEQSGEISEAVKATEEVAGIQNPLQGKEVSKRGLGAVMFGLSLIPGFAGKGVKPGAVAKGADDVVQNVTDAKSAKQVSEIIIKQKPDSDPNVVQAASEFLAKETNPETVKQVLQDLEIDPGLNLSPEQIARLQDEGIQAVKQGDTEYGAEYQDNNITLRDNSYVNDATIDHEIGHHVWQNRLTPEERELFRDINGQAARRAIGRPGYDAEDVMSEDFSDFLAMARSGRLNEVPEQVREVVAKYARVANEESVRFSEAGANAKTAVKQGGKAAKAIVRGMDPNVADPLNTLVNALAKSPNKAENRAIIEGLFPGIPNDLKTPLVKAVTNAEDSDQVLEAIARIVADKPIVADDIAKAADEATPTPVPTAAQEADEFVAPAAPVQTGVAPEAPAGKFADEVNDAPSAANNFPDATPEDQAAIQQVMDELAGIDKTNKGVDKVRAQQRAARVNAGEGGYVQAGGGEAGFRAKLGSLKGKYEESGYTPISVDPEVESSLLDAIEKSSLRSFEKLNTQNALRKVWGANPDKPTKSDVIYIRKFFNEHYGEGVGDELAKGIEEALQGTQSYEDVMANIAGLPRALMATGDLSGGFRQAAPLGTRYPKIWAKANAESVKYALNPKYYEQEMKKMTDSDAYAVISDKLGVDLPGAGAMADEGFIGADYAEKIPLYGKLAIKPAERAYQGVLAKLRFEVANKVIEKAGGADKYLKHMDEIYGDKADEAMRAYGEVINTLSGRGGKKGGLADKHMKTAATLLFAPRLWIANVQRLNPVWYAKLYRKNPDAAKLALQAQGTFLATAGSVLGVAAAMGASVGTDPRSADFGKIKVGNTRYDILGGQQQNIVQFARQVTGEKINSETGELDTIGDEYGESNRWDLAVDMFTNKSNPLLGFGIKLMQTKDDESTDSPLKRKDKFDQDYNVASEFGWLGVPLGVHGAIDTSKDVGNAPKGIAMNAPSFVGVGVQTYGNTATKDQGVTKEDGTKGYKGKVSDDMVLDEKGKPYLNDKGVPVKVKFDKDATDLEKKALKDDKAKSLRADAYKKGLSKEDQSLMKLDQDTLDDYKKEGVISSKKYDEIKDHKQRVKNLGNIDIPDGAKTKQARSFYEKFNSMDKEDQDRWLDDKPDEIAKGIAEGIQKDFPAELQKLKPSNRLAKLYAEYEKDLNDNPDYTDIDKRNKAKNFQIDAYKLNYSEKVRDIFAEGGSADVKHFISEGQMSKEELDQAVQLDNELFNSGLAGSLKFSKTFRKNYAYGVPNGKAGVNDSEGGGGGGGRGGDTTQSAQLAALMPSFKKGEAKPEFSAKRRGSGQKIGGFTPKVGASKKITINL